MSVPLIFKTLELRNFLSFGQTAQTIELDGQGTVTITGENRDQSCSNGSGKCLFSDTRINIRIHGAIKQITIGELYEFARQMETHKRSNNF